jgi:hypothetical protein
VRPAGRSLAFALLLGVLAIAGCAGSDARPAFDTSEQARCEGGRGTGVWVAAAGACLRGGGGM